MHEDKHTCARLLVIAWVSLRFPGSCWVNRNDPPPELARIIEEGVNHHPEECVHSGFLVGFSPNENTARVFSLLATTQRACGQTTNRLEYPAESPRLPRRNWRDCS